MSPGRLPPHVPDLAVEPRAGSAGMCSISVRGRGWGVSIPGPFAGGTRAVLLAARPQTAAPGADLCGFRSGWGCGWMRLAWARGGRGAEAACDQNSGDPIRLATNCSMVAPEARNATCAARPPVSGARPNNAWYSNETTPERYSFEASRSCAT